MTLIVVGTNYRYSPLELREKLSFSKSRLKEALCILKERGILDGAVIISTCNRVELYACAHDIRAGYEEAAGFICRYHEVSASKLQPYLYKYHTQDAVRHLFFVAAGLDSMILAETQISGQVRFAFEQAQAVGFAGGFLKNIFTDALSFAKDAHSKAKIPEGKISAAGVAVDFIKQKLAAISGKNILVIGTGEIARLILGFFKKEPPKAVFISSRTYEKAKDMAAQINGQAARFDRLKDYIKDADAVITATGSPHFIIKKETLADERNKPLLIIDLAFPRDVDPQVREIKNIELFYLEGLKEIIKNNIEKYRLQIDAAKDMAAKEAKDTWIRYTQLQPEAALLP